MGVENDTRGGIIGVLRTWRETNQKLDISLIFLSRASSPYFITPTWRTRLIVQRVSHLFRGTLSVILRRVAVGTNASDGLRMDVIGGRGIAAM